jgi:hypothetical protein
MDETSRIKVMSDDLLAGPKRVLFACALTGLLAVPALAQPLQGKEGAGMPAPAATAAVAHSVTSGRQATALRRLWGVDDIHVRSTASGSLIRFSYRVVDADKAAILNNKKVTPYLVDEKNSLALQVPMMENVGQLRQVATPENGREYWMAFSNKGRSVKPGSRVTVIVGRLRIDGLVVE